MKNNKQLFINMAANLIAFAVNLGINFFLTPYIINTVGNEAYGFIPLANNFISYVNIFTIALNSMASRYISMELNRGNETQANVYFNSVLLSNTMISVIISLPSILMVLYINHILNIPEYLLRDVQITFIFVFLNLIVGLLGNVFAVATFAKNRLELSSKRNIEGNIIRGAVILLLFCVFQPKIYFVTATALIVTIYTVVTNVIFTKKLTPELKFKPHCFSFGAIRKLVSSGVWNSVNQLSTVLLNSLDLILANIFIDAAASGEYAIVKTIPNFIQSLVATLVSVFVPEFTILYAQRKQKELIDSIEFSIKIMGLTITLPIAFLLINGDAFYSLWVPGENISKLYLLSCLTIIPMIITGSMNTIFNVYTVTAKLKVPAIVLLITGLINTGIVFLLLTYTNLGVIAIPLVAAIIGILRNIIFTPIYAAYCLNEKWFVFYKAIGKGILCTITMMCVTYALRLIVPPTSWVLLIVSAALAAMIAFVINCFLVLSKKERIMAIGIVRDILKRKGLRKK